MENNILSKNQETILELLQNGESVKEISENKHKSVQAIYKTIKKIKKKGLYLEEKDFNSEMDQCYICHITKKEVLIKHHLIPKYQGGEDNKENIMKLCCNCHFLIHNKLRIGIKLNPETYIFYNKGKTGIVNVKDLPNLIYY